MVRRRRGCGCSRGRLKNTNRQVVPLTMEERKKFVELMDSGASVRRVKRELRMQVSEINNNVYLLPYHRLVLKLTKELVDNKHLAEGNKEERFKYKVMRDRIDKEIKKKWREMING